MQAERFQLLINDLSVDVSQVAREVVVWKVGRTALGESCPSLQKKRPIIRLRWQTLATADCLMVEVRQSEIGTCACRVCLNEGFTSLLVWHPCHVPISFPIRKIGLRLSENLCREFSRVS